MERSVFRFTLNMHNHRSQASVSVFRGDTAIRLCFALADGSNVYKIEDGCVAILSGTKADGNKLWNRCTIENNTIIYDFTKQTASCVGIANCEITLYGADEEIITAPKFIIVVDEREFSDQDVNVSESELNAMDIVMSAAALISQNGGISGVIVDRELSQSSVNPVQNKVITQTIENILSRIRVLESIEGIKPEEPDIDTPIPGEPDETVVYIYYGVGDVKGTEDDPFDFELIESLTKTKSDSRECSFTVEPILQYMYFVAPKSYCTDDTGKDLTTFIVDNFWQGGFEKPKLLNINGEEYYVYRSTEKIGGETLINVR